MIRTIHRAKYVLAEVDSLLQNAAVHVSAAGRISRVEPWNGPPANAEVELIDWGSSVILPGLVNVHTHLDLSRLHGRITEFSSFTDWVSQLIHKRREWTPADYADSARKGCRLSLAAGTTLIGDISTNGMSWEALKSEKLRKIVFEEVLTTLPEDTREVMDRLEDRLNKVEIDDLLTSGISPHAPYSVSAGLYQAVYQLGRLRKLPIATHMAETKEELQYLHSGDGEFRTFLIKLGAFPEGWDPPGLAPAQYLERNGILQRPALLIHCNYLDDDSMATIFRSGSSVAFCPRSHAFFRHDEHPVRRLLDLGVNVALGTDSLASNDSLSIMDEMRFLFEGRRDLRVSEIFRMATINGASALGLGNVLGRLRRGYWADMTVLDVPERLGPKTLTTKILEGAGNCAGTVIRGDVVWDKSHP